MSVTAILALALLPLHAAPPAATNAGARLRELVARDGVLVVGHRGDSGSHPENTVPAFRSAVAQGAHLVELDFRQARDGELFCFHDDTLDRTTNAREALEATKVKPETRAWTELRRLDAGAWKGPAFRGTPIPTLEEALDAIGGDAIPMIEHKTGDAERLIALLDRLERRHDVVVQSFDWDFLAAVRRLDPSICLGALGSGALDDAKVARLVALDVDFVHWKAADLTFDTIDAARARGWLVVAYTVNDDLGMAGAATLGVSAVTTDRPGRLREVLERLRPEAGR